MPVTPFLSIPYPNTGDSPYDLHTALIQVDSYLNSRVNLSPAGPQTGSFNLTGSGVLGGALAVGGNLSVAGAIAWGGVWPDANVADALTIAGGTVNNTPIGAITPSTGRFTDLEATGTVILPGVTSSGTGSFATLTVSGASTLASLTLTTPLADAYVANALTISGGTVNSSPIGATTPSTGAFTTLTSSGLASLASLSVAGATTLGAVTAGATTVTTLGASGASTLASLSVAGATTLAGLTAGATTVTTLGASGASTLQAVTATTITGTTINASTALQLGGANINTAGVLTNVAYLNQANVFTALQHIRTATEQLRIGPDASNYLSVAVAATVRFCRRPCAAIEAVRASMSALRSVRRTLRRLTTR